MKDISDKNSEAERQLSFASKIKELLSEKKGKTPGFFVQTFGCQMNERDSEKMAGILLSCGYSPVSSEEEADVILYNTCTVRDNANVRVFGRLGVLKGLKEKNPDLMDTGKRKAIAAGSGGNRKDKEKLFLCGSYLRHP